MARTNWRRRGPNRSATNQEVRPDRLLKGSEERKRNFFSLGGGTKGGRIELSEKEGVTRVTFRRHKKSQTKGGIGLDDKGSRVSQGFTLRTLPDQKKVVVFNRRGTAARRLIREEKRTALKKRRKGRRGGIFFFSGQKPFVERTM